MKERISQIFSQSIAVKQAIIDDARMIDDIADVAEICIGALTDGNKIIFAGNGGSAADAQHIAAELVGRFERDRKGLAAIALNTNASSLTAIANDYGYDSVFSRQIEALANKGDVFFGFSTSGNSTNIVSAIRCAGELGVITIGMTGQGGGAMRGSCDRCLCVPSDNTARVQESHITIGHIICSLIEQAIFPDD